jgi:hypothetical protein
MVLNDERFQREPLRLWPDFITTLTILPSLPSPTSFTALGSVARWAARGWGPAPVVLAPSARCPPG